MERHRSAAGNYLSEDAIAGRRLREVKRRARPVNLRIDEDLYRALREESEAARLTLSAVMRLALAHGVERVAADRVARAVGAGGK